MSTIDLLEPLFADGIAAPNYFNGRVLSAEDLLQAADAEHQVDRLLGRAIGEGVAYGLEVFPAPATGGVPTVRVEAGLAINRRGVAVRLPAWQSLRLGVTAPVRGGRPGFADCGDVPGPAYTGRSGVYLLTIGPVRGNRGLAPVTGLRNVTADCNVREVVAGVQFRLIPLPVEGLDLTVPGRLRNLVAARCLGIEELLALKGVASGGDIAAYGAIDELRRAGTLTECEVPLATLRLDGSALAFVDRWSARRRPVRPAAERRWPHLVGDRRLAEAEAFFLQFQDQLLDIAPTGGDASRIESPAHFGWLPPAGILPVGPRRFTPRTFLKAQTLEPVAADHALARQVIHDSFYREPFKADDPDVPIQLLQFEDHPEYVVFARVERLVGTPPPTIEPEAGPGGFDIRITWDEPGESTITDVWAQDAKGKRYPATGQKRTVLGSFGGLLFDETIARYSVQGLAPGQYWVKVQSRNYRIASVQATAVAKTSVQVSVRLTNRDHGCPPKHKLTRPVDKILVEPAHRLVDNAGNFYGGFAVMHDYRAEASALPQVAVQAPRMQLADTVRDQIVDRWECWLQVDPDVLVATEIGPEIWIDPHFDPKVYPPPPDPYAWMKLGEVIYPLILLPQERALPTSVPVTKAGIDEVGVEQYATVLDAMGLGDMDVLAGAWRGLVQDALELAPGVAGAVAEQIATQAETFLDTKQYYPGVSAEIGRAVLESDNALLKDDVAIANATAEQVAAQLMEVARDAFATEADALALASRMVTTARDFVPRSAWAIDDPALGLNAALRDAIAGQGIQSKGELAAASAEVRTGIAEAAGTSVETVNTIATASDVLVAAYGDFTKPEQSLAQLNLSETQVERLIEVGITSPTELATTDVDLTATLGIDATRATNLQTEAAGVATAKWSGLKSAVEGAGTVDVTSTLGSAVTGSTIVGGLKLVGGIG